MQIRFQGINFNNSFNNFHSRKLSMRLEKQIKIRISFKKKKKINMRTIWPPDEKNVENFSLYSTTGKTPN